MEQGERVKESVTTLLFGVAFLSIFITIIITFLTIGRISKPIIAVAKSADSIANGDYSHRVVVKTNDEIALLANSFNKMAASIQHSQKEQAEFKTILYSIGDGVITTNNAGVVKLMNLVAERLTGLSESEERFRSVTQSANDAIISADSKGIIIEWNLSAEKIFGYSKEMIIGENLETIIPQSYRDIHNIQLERVSLGGEHHIIGKTVEMHGLHISRKEFPIELSLAEWQTSKGKFFTGIIRDISERKKAEIEIKLKNEQLIKLNSEKDKFFSIIAHDLKSPFQGFIGLTELLANEHEDFSKVELVELGKSLYESASTVYKLLENLLEWAQMQKGTISFTPGELLLFKAVSSSINTVNQRALQKGISIINEVDETQKVYADEKMISTVLRNFLSNAVKFTKREGQIIVRTKKLDDEMVEVSVSDTGVGMAEKDVNKLFKVEEKVSSKGTEGEPSTGLGLLLCKEFIEKNGGKVRAESEKGKGSIFYFTVPESNDKNI
ncbi:MAG: PAS domain S-box protein [Ignavibacteria bacterium]|nr:PAS domain S-box protein [Ignavibacteria bacterium]